MPDVPCGDFYCWDCYPEFRCDHNHEPRDAEPGDIHDCPDCGAVLVAVGHDDLPEVIRRARERALASVARYHARRGTEPPAQPATSWQELVPATRIPGSAP